METIPIYKFHKKKYGDELLVDVVDMDYIRAGIYSTPVRRYTFYCIVVVTNGYEEIAINEHKYKVSPGNVICSIPGEIWNWQKHCTLDGYVLIFEEDFLHSFFIDPLYLQKLPYLSNKRNSPFFRLNDKLYHRIVPLFAQMKTEIDDYNEKDQHLLRALLYTILTLLNRAESVKSTRKVALDITFKRYVEPFISMVATEYSTQRNIRYYADRLCITPNYLNAVVRQSLGVTAKLYIQRRIIQEARRLLLYTTLSVAEIADKLNFESVSYFVRFFNKHVGVTPKQFRDRLES